jgi:lysophospholipase L1-like esterase
MLSARLTFAPDELVEVRRATGESVPLDGITIQGDRLLVSGRADLPALTDDELIFSEPCLDGIGKHRDGKRHIRFSEGSDYHRLQLSIDYRTRAQWTGPVPQAQRQELARAHQRLERGEGLTLAVLGDSISSGANASAIVHVPPYQPAYPQLLARRLQKETRGTISLYNLSKGGMRSAWGREQCPRVIGVMPDLLIIAFGMNDASDGIPVEDFRQNIEAIIGTVRATLPDCEVIVVSGMMPNPEWHLSQPEVRQHMHEQLRALQGPGVAFCDVNSIWSELVRRKGFFSLTGNGVNHPNDFGHRLYADCLYATFDLKEKGEFNG